MRRPAGLDREGAAIREGAARPGATRLGRATLERGRERAAGEARDRGEQAARIGMGGIDEDAPRVAVEDDLAAIHHRDARADAGDRAEVVADIDHRGAQPRRELGEQVEDMRLRGDVEPGGRLVEQQRLRLAGERHRDGDALLLAAGQLVRVAPRDGVGIGKPHLREQFAHAGRMLRGRARAMQGQDLGDLGLDPQVGRQRLSGVLRDQREAPPADALELLARLRQQVDAGEADAAGGGAQPALEMPHRGEEQRALARSALADDPDGLAAAHREVDPAQDLEHAARATREADAQAGDLDQRRVLHVSARALPRGRRPAPWRARRRRG